MAAIHNSPHTTQNETQNSDVMIWSFWCWWQIGNGESGEKSPTLQEHVHCTATAQCSLSEQMEQTTWNSCLADGTAAARGHGVERIE